MRIGNKIRGRKDVAEVIKTLRRARKKKLREVVEETELFTDTAHLSKIEHGVWGFKDIDKLSEYLDYYGYQLMIVKKDA
jgi:transcriptional regulator with XRE-family HTH domain